MGGSTRTWPPLSERITAANARVGDVFEEPHSNPNKPPVRYRVLSDEVTEDGQHVEIEELSRFVDTIWTNPWIMVVSMALTVIWAIVQYWPEN